MKATLVLISLLLGQNALAQGRWMFSQEPASEAPARAAVTTESPRHQAPREVLPARQQANVTRPTAKKPSLIPDGCSSNFATASSYFKAVHGNDVDIRRIGEFQGSFQDLTATNTLKESGGTLILNLKIVGIVNINADVPVKICKRGKRLTAMLRTSKTREANSSQPQAMISQMVASGAAPRSITLSVARQGSKLNFSGQAGSTRVSASASIR